MKDKAKHQCKIEKKGWFSKKWKADPVTVDSQKENEVTWDSDETDFMVWFPPDWNPLEGTNQSGRMRTFAARVKSSVQPGQRYQYSIFCYSGNELAEGGSSPEIIIQ